MDIRELRDFLNSLSEDVLDYDVKTIGIYRPEYEDILKCDIVLDTNTESDIKCNRGLYLTIDSFQLEESCDLCIIPNDMKIIKEDID